MGQFTTINDFVNRANFEPQLLQDLTVFLENYIEVGRMFALGFFDPNSTPVTVSMGGFDGSRINYSIDYRQLQPTGPIPSGGKLGTVASISGPTPQGLAGFVPVLTSCIGSGQSPNGQWLVRILNQGWFADGPAAHPGAYPTDYQLLKAVAPQLIPAVLL